MSELFRSDPPQVGDRVTLAYQPEGAPLTELIGQVLELDPLVILPQAGGNPVRVTGLQALRRMPARRVRNSEIRALEEATARAFPGIEHRFSSDAQWLLRAGDGITERSNSALPIGRAALFSPLPMAEIEVFYARHGLPVCLMIPERIGRSAATLVEREPGRWKLSPEIMVMTHDLATVPDLDLSLAEHPGWETPDDVPPATYSAPTQAPGLAPTQAPGFSLSAQPDAAWLSLYHFRGQALPADALELLRREIDGEMAFARLTSASGETIAITRATLTGAGDGRTYLGFSAVEVAAAWRRRGLGSILTQAVLAWGKSRGADLAYLQAAVGNAASLGLYTKLGFSEHHRQRAATRIR